MRVLLIAHEFPPIPSPQSLRWAYLANELALAGHEVHVLAPDHPGYGPAGGTPELNATIHVHRTFPGPLAWLLGRVRKRPKLGTRDWTLDLRASDAVTQGAPHVGLNWKGRLLDYLSRGYGALWFPDARAEWTPWARRALRRLLETTRPDIVIASHEPASTLLLGLQARSQGYRLLVDLGDPVLASYTPKRWRRRALQLEAAVCSQSDLLTVTSAATKALLVRRHAVAPERVQVLEQGFDHRLAPVPAGTPTPQGGLVLLYTGSFYSFRRADQLVQAVLETPGTRLLVASPVAPQALQEAAQRHPESIRLLGHVSHRVALSLQRQADLLVNLANEFPEQVPGKVYEYLGAGRRILHIGSDGTDEVAFLLHRTGAGVACGWGRAEISAALCRIMTDFAGGNASVRDEQLISRYAWSAHGHRLSGWLEAIAALPPGTK